jgi:hypothetical protein
MSRGIRLGVDADDLAKLADAHHLGGVVDQVDGGDLAVLLVPYSRS